jgi:hypothetical protein
MLVHEISILQPPTVLLFIRSRASTAWSKSSADIQIELWNKHMTNNDVWVFSHEIKELSCKLIFIVIYILYIFIVSSTLLAHMDVLHEPFLP